MKRRDKYAEAGVDYSILDEKKRRAVEAARATAANPSRLRVQVDEASYGEPATTVRVSAPHVALVLECLGTKSIIATDVETELGIDRFFDVGYDTVAAAVNDVVAVGALPIVVNAYFASGSDFYVGRRHDALVEGFRRACDEAGAAWGGGESPALSGLIADRSIDLAAAALGQVPHGRRPMLGDALGAGDEVVLVASSGLHQNGASLARRVVRDGAGSWADRLPSGRAFGEALLDRGLLYAPLLESLYESGIAPHYASNLTGHGWRKLMRAERDFTYRVATVPDVPEVLSYLAERAELSDEEAYATLNMGAGFALFVPEGAGADVVDLAQRAGYVAHEAGRLEEGPRRVVIEPLGVTYAKESLGVR